MAYYKATEKETSVEHPVSVIICARDEAHNLVKNLPGVLVQDYATTHEVVLVNDNSTDESKYVIDEFRRSFKNLNMIELTQEAKMISGKKFPLSMGIKSAKYEIVLLTDADCVPATCCHATAAVPKNLAPECENNICTQECVPNTLDCGQGEIRCLENNCQIVLK